jgi:thioredoxin-like negative regulator of GroEL
MQYTIDVTNNGPQVSTDTQLSSSLPFPGMAVDDPDCQIVLDQLTCLFGTLASGELAGKLKVVKLNVDENPETASKYGIMSIPTLMIFKNGELASRQIGAAPKAKLVQWINGAI